MSTRSVTLEMILAEVRRVNRVMKKSYPEQVRKQQLTPWERDHRFAVWDKLEQLIETDHKNKNTNKPNLVNILNQLP